VSKACTLARVAFVLAMLNVSLVYAQDAPPAWVDQARSAAGQLGSHLQRVLQSTMAEQGAVAAVDVCHLEAPQIAAGVSTGSMSVGRTALRVRNPENAPDAWEQQVLEQFQQRLAAGESPDSLELFALRRQSDGQRSAHWMRAIPTQAACLACHGPSVAPEIKAAIDERYPDDRATGFQVGELRGAFSIQMSLPAKP